LPPLEKFELTRSDGQPFRSEEMKGKVWVASFFFSTCPGSCKRLNTNIKYLSSLEEIEGVTWVSITVDPETDTLPVLSEYAKTYNADPQRWIFCRGEFDYVRRLAHDVLKVGGVMYKDHNDYAVIVDKNGEIADMFNASSTSESERGVKTLKKLLAEEYDPPLQRQRAGSSPTAAAPPISPTPAPQPAEAA
jgi:protein SCO1/2